MMCNLTVAATYGAVLCVTISRPVDFMLNLHAG